ncbi:MAG: glycosyltransferase family 4 protein [Pyrinomonadaceae bacterium]
MEYFGGGKNVMLATGGSADPPSQRNENIKWIFSTSLKREQLANGKSKELPGDGRVRLVIACRQEERKGTDIVIASMPSILRSIPNATLDVIGDGALLPKLKKQAISLGLNDNIRFHGKVVHSKVIDLMSKGHLFCYPTNASEGFPKVVLEALASGLPVITTKVSVLPDLIRSGGGVILNSPNASGLAETVLNICSDSAKYEEMSSMAIEVARQYSLESWRDFIGETLRDAWNVRSLSNLTESRRRILNA